MPTCRPAERRLLLAALAVAPWVLHAPRAEAGTQREEDLSASVRAGLAQAVGDRGTVNWEDLELRAWVRGMTRRVQRFLPDEEQARQCLALVRYESLRAGLDPHMVLALIEVESRFKKYAVSKAGARGLMQVMPFWVKVIGAPGMNLFNERTNLRFGCVILRHYVDRENGKLFNALGRYNGSLGRPEYPDRILKSWKSRWALSA